MEVGSAIMESLDPILVSGNGHHDIFLSARWASIQKESCDCCVIISCNILYFDSSFYMFLFTVRMADIPIVQCWTLPVARRVFQMLSPTTSKASISMEVEMTADLSCFWIRRSRSAWTVSRPGVTSWAVTSWPPARSCPSSATPARASPTPSTTHSSPELRSSPRPRNRRAAPLGSGPATTPTSRSSSSTPRACWAVWTTRISEHDSCWKY